MFICFSLDLVAINPKLSELCRKFLMVFDDLELIVFWPNYNLWQIPNIICFLSRIINFTQKDSASIFLELPKLKNFPMDFWRNMLFVGYPLELWNWPIKNKRRLNFKFLTDYRQILSVGKFNRPQTILSSHFFLHLVSSHFLSDFHLTLFQSPLSQFSSHPVSL